MLAAPATFFVLTLIAAPVGMTIAYSFWTQDYVDIRREFTWANYKEVFADPLYRMLIFRSVKIATLVTFLTVILAYLIAYFIAFNVKKSKAMWVFLVTIPFWTSYLPILLLPLFSFNDSKAFGLPLSGFTTKWYVGLAEQTALFSALKNSLFVALVSAIIATALGTLISRAIVKYRYPMRRVSHTIVMVPLVMPEIIIAISLLGPSGCGKSTLLRMIAGFEEPSKGAIAIDGRDMAGTEANNRPTNIVFQSYAIFPHLNVEENIVFGLAKSGLSKTQNHAKAEDMLEKVGLSGLGHRGAHELSGGQRQRVALARALVMEPKVL